MKNSRKSLLPKQVFSIILSLMVFNCYNLLIFYYISQRRCFWKLFVFPLRKSRSLFIWTSSIIFFNLIFLLFSMLILPLGDPSFYRGSVWRILMVEQAFSDLLPVSWWFLSVALVYLSQKSPRALLGHRTQLLGKHQFLYIFCRWNIHLADGNLPQLGALLDL